MTVNNMTEKIFKFFDRLEDKTRARLSRSPLLYALIGGIGIILFWRGVWHLADDLSVNSLASSIIGGTILLLTGAFVSTFIGNRLIITGLSGDKKLAEKTKEEIMTEEDEIQEIKSTLNRMEKHIGHIESRLK